MSNDNHLNKLASYVPKYHLEKVRKISKSRKISMARLVAFAIDRELQIERPFDFDCSLEGIDNIEYAYADEAGRILNFIKTLRIGAGLDVLVLCRFEMNIPDKSVFLAAFKECLDKNMIEGFKPPVNPNRAPNADDYLYYRLIGDSPKDRKKMSKEAKEFEKYQKLKKKFDGKE